jgi:hypothetical protein
MNNTPSEPLGNETAYCTVLQYIYRLSQMKRVSAAYKQWQMDLMWQALYDGQQIFWRRAWQ